MNIDVSLKQEFANDSTETVSSGALKQLQECVGRMGGSLVSKGLRSAPTEFVVTGIDDKTAADAAVSQLLECEAVAGAYIKPQTYLPNP
jgi:hypothetical protein